MKMMVFSLLSLLFLSGPLCAGDISGKWTGSFEFNNEQGETKSEAIYMIFKQEGDTLSGSGGPNESEQHPFKSGKVEGEKVTFEVSKDKMTIAFDLKIKGDQIHGDMKAEKNGTMRTAKLTLKRLAEK